MVPLGESDLHPLLLIAVGMLQLAGSSVTALEAAQKASNRPKVFKTTVLGTSGATMVLIATLYLLSL